jgi:hypothetical protein
MVDLLWVREFLPVVFLHGLGVCGWVVFKGRQLTRLS